MRETSKGHDYLRMQGSICRHGELISMTLNNFFFQFACKACGGTTKQEQCARYEIDYNETMGNIRFVDLC